MADDIDQEANTKFVTANGIRMAYREHGNADDPVLMLVAGIYTQ